MHGAESEIDWNRFLVSHTEHIPQVFDVNLPKGTSQWPYPLPRCPGPLRIWNGLRYRFNFHHWGDSLQILKEHPTPLPKYNRCGIQVPPWRFRNQNYEPKKIQAKEESCIRRMALQHCFKAIWVSISVDAEPLEPVEVFLYLGRTVAYNNSNWDSLYQNIWKSRR